MKLLGFALSATIAAAVALSLTSSPTSGADQVEPLNEEGNALCREFNGVLAKYPFNRDATAEATLSELNALFRPGDGALWRFYESSLRGLLENVGGRYVRSRDAVPVRDEFLSFFNRAAGLSTALYSRGSTQPLLSYSIELRPGLVFRSITLVLDGQSLRAERHVGGSKEFIWPAPGYHLSELRASFGGPEIGLMSYDGLWAQFRLFSNADSFERRGSIYRLEWVPRQGPRGLPIYDDQGFPVSVQVELDLKGSPPVFDRGYLDSFSCVAEVTHE